MYSAPNNFYCHLDFEEFTNLYQTLKYTIKSICKLYELNSIAFSQMKKIKKIHDCLESLIEEAEDNIFEYENNNSIDDIQEIYCFLSSTIDDFVLKCNKLIDFIINNYGKSSFQLFKIQGVHIEQMCNASNLAGVDLVITQKYYLKYCN